MKILFGMLIVAVVASGCSLARPDKQTINITCSQQDLVVKVNGDRVTCPSKVDVRRDSKVVFEATKEGHETFSKTIDYHLSTAGKWDVVGTLCLLVPVVGLMSPGAWDLDQTDFSIQLHPTHK